MDKINQDVDGKIDRTELDAFRDYIEKQMKKLKKLAVRNDIRKSKIVIEPSFGDLNIHRQNFSQPLIIYSKSFLSIAKPLFCPFVSCSMCCIIYLKKDQQSNQQHVHVMSEDEAAGLRKQLIRFHCISCDRPIDVQPHQFVSSF